MRVAVLGHSALNIAPAVAADLALRGWEVAWWPAPPEVWEGGGIQVRGGHAHLDAEAGDFARVRPAASAEAALAEARVVITDIPPERLVAEVGAVAPAIRPGALLHVQSHGYWPALRLAAALRRRDIILTDSSAPTHAAGFRQGLLVPHWRRQGLRFSAVQGDPMALLRQLYPGAEAAGSALETGLEGINLMVHPALSLLNIAAFERAGEAGQGFGFYAEGNTASTGMLAAALDAERGAICLALGVRHRTLPQALAAMYGARGDDPLEAVATCAFYQGLGALPADSWRRWAVQDLPFAIMPLLRLAERAGVQAPVHTAIAAIHGILLGQAAGAPELGWLGPHLPSGDMP